MICTPSPAFPTGTDGEILSGFRINLWWTVKILDPFSGLDQKCVFKFLWVLVSEPQLWILLLLCFLTAVCQGRLKLLFSVHFTCLLFILTGCISTERVHRSSKKLMKIHLLSAGSLIPDKADSSKCHTSQDLPCFLSFQLFVMVTRRLTQCSLAVGLELCLQHSPLTCLQHCLSRDAALASRTPLLQELCCAALQWSGALSKWVGYVNGHCISFHILLIKMKLKVKIKQIHQNVTGMIDQIIFLVLKEGTDFVPQSRIWDSEF